MTVLEKADTYTEVIDEKICGSKSSDLENPKEHDDLVVGIENITPKCHVRHAFGDLLEPVEQESADANEEKQSKGFLEDSFTQKSGELAPSQNVQEYLSIEKCCSGQHDSQNIIGESLTTVNASGSTMNPISNNSNITPVKYESSTVEYAYLVENEDQGSATDTTNIHQSADASPTSVHAVFRKYTEIGSCDLDKSSVVRGRLRTNTSSGISQQRSCSSCDTSCTPTKNSEPFVFEGTTSSPNDKNQVADTNEMKEHMSEHVPLPQEKGNILNAVCESDGQLEDGLSNTDPKVTKAKSKTAVLEAENAELMETLEAVKDFLMPYNGLILYPTYAKKLALYPQSQQPVIELAMKANFFKSWYEIRQKNREGNGMSIESSENPSEE
eukprot:TRINITY_DN8597_c0_g2_i1.p1 TRINITY_DN8597_c0_g2~~TRINITY_DN8597_c0_g2_i1.p1  ORF type:complete len:384 (-),score=106.24 TRINITY_DN8597_c0_g2_i1:8-1159(-)